MRKIVKPPKICEQCGATLIHAIDVAFCDLCKEKIPEGIRIDSTVFWTSHSSNATRNEFCSWNCFFKWIKKFPYNKKMVSFINIPSLGDCDKEFEDELKTFLEAIYDITGEM